MILWYRCRHNGTIFLLWDEIFTRESVGFNQNILRVYILFIAD
jgi:hypothetical protein